MLNRAASPSASTWGPARHNRGLSAVSVPSSAPLSRPAGGRISSLALVVPRLPSAVRFAVNGRWPEDSRTAFGNATTYHNAKYLTFHRIANFRKRAMQDKPLGT